MLSSSSWYIHLCPLWESRTFWNWQGCHHPLRVQHQRCGNVPFLFASMLSDCERAMHELSQRKQDGHDCLSHFCPFSWNYCGRSLIRQRETWSPVSPVCSSHSYLSVISSGLFVVLYSARLLSCNVLRVEAAALTCSHVLWAHCSVWMDGLHAAVQYEPIKLVQDALTPR